MTGRRASLALVTVLTLAGCGSGGSASTGSDADDGGPLTVLAASSLSEPFRALAERFQRDHRGVEVRLAFDSSATLAQQVREGAPADVLATADLETMRQVLDSGDARRAETFATNRMVLVAPRDNAAGITGVEDLDGAEVRYVVCVVTAPCGKVAAELLERNGVTHDPSSLEVDVKSVLAKVTADEADAGLVYASDAHAARDAVATFAVPGADATPNSYAIAVVERSPRSALAEEWVELLTGPQGRRVLDRAGFGPPP